MVTLPLNSPTSRLSFDIPNKGCSSFWTFTLILCYSWVLPSTHSLTTVSPPPFLPFWIGSAINMQTDLGAYAGTVSPMSHVCHKIPFFWDMERQCCPSKGLRHFWIQIHILGTENSTPGWTRGKKKIMFSFSVWHLPGGRKCRAHWKSYCWNSDQPVIKCHDLICQSCSHFQGQSLHLCMRICVRVRRACAFKEICSGFILLNFLHRNEFCFQQSRSLARLLPSQHGEARFLTPNLPIKAMKVRGWSNNYDLDRDLFCYMINHTQCLKTPAAYLLLVCISSENPTYKIARRKVNKSELVIATCKSYTFQCLDIGLRYLFSFVTLGFVTNLPLIGFSQCRSFDSFSLSVLTCQPPLHQLYLLQSSPVNCHSLHTVCQ